MRVYSHSCWLVICCTTNSTECWRGRGGKLSRILGKNTIFNEHPVCLQQGIWQNKTNHFDPVEWGWEAEGCQAEALPWNRIHLQGGSKWLILLHTRLAQPCAFDAMPSLVPSFVLVPVSNKLIRTVCMLVSILTIQYRIAQHCIDQPEGVY